LQARLDEKHPTRHSESYKAQDVLSIKLDLLLKFTPSSPPPVIDWDDNDADYDDIDIELQNILPEKIAFLDLSSLDLKNRVDISFPLLIRKEYGVISTLIDKGINDVASSCILTGQSSVGKAIQHYERWVLLNAMLGKTTFIYMLLIERILKATETYFEGPAGDIYSISDAGVREMHSMTSSHPDPLKSEDRMALIDGPATGGIYVVSGTRTPIVRTSSLQDHRSRTLALGASRYILWMYGQRKNSCSRGMYALTTVS
jgi:hypothetical protein